MWLSGLRRDDAVDRLATRPERIVRGIVTMLGSAGIVLALRAVRDDVSTPWWIAIAGGSVVVLAAGFATLVVHQRNRARRRARAARRARRPRE